MTRTDRPLDNPINWSFQLGHLFGIAIRVHVLFLLCAFLLVWMQFPPPNALETRTLGSILAEALGTYAVLFSIVFLHELGHCFGSRFTGGTADEILLWPLGGLAYVNPRNDAIAHMITAVSGPMVNIALCATSSAILVFWTGSLGAVPWNPIHPLSPLDSSVVPVGGLYWVVLIFGISYFLLAVNLLPIFPFDGGRILQAWLWTTKGYRTSMEIAAGTGMVGAILFGLFGLFSGQSWFFLMIAVYGYIKCWEIRRSLREHDSFDAAALGYDFSKGYSPLEDEREPANRPGFFTQRRLRRAAQREERLRLREEQRQAAVDDILRKVAQTGLASLTSRERRILQEETKKQRKRDPILRDFQRRQ